MLETLFKRRPKILEAQECWMREFIDSYLENHAQKQHAKCSIRINAYLLLRFAAFVQKHGCCEISKIVEWIGAFAEQHENRNYQTAILQEMRRFIRYLQEEEIIPVRIPPKAPFSNVVCEYEEFLRNRCNMSQPGIASRSGFCQRFLCHVHDSGIRQVKAIDLSVVQKFIISEGNSHTRRTMITYCSVLRRFLSYLYWRGEIQRDISSLIISPKSYKHERCPKFFTDAQISAVLSSVDRQTSIGMRNYAMILLLATYGLRSKEVAQLRLDDIDWRAEKLHIRRRKSGNISTYPLAPSVGEAILCYLKNSRPKSSHRQVFLAHAAPYNPVTSSALGHATNKHLLLCGIKKRGINAHAFRYSCAQQLFENDFSIKEIADYLGHRQLTSTQRYMKIDIKHLREVALNSGEEML
ncbi:MAG: site-specific integrase [Planctomycetota bacterium]|jgi:site-specific recombinase XerD